MAQQQLSLPIQIPFASESAGSEEAASSAARFPHTRAQLAALGQQHDEEGGSELAGADGGGAAGGGEGGGAEAAAAGDIWTGRGHGEQRLADCVEDVADSEQTEQSVLELMHKHRDDVAGVPFLFLTPTRRPISRPSSRASSRVNSSAPSSPLVHALSFRRPHTPATSPLAGLAQPSYMSAKSDYSPSSSPVLMHAYVSSQFTASLPASPISSPRLLNAKANEFRPIPRPLSAASSNPGALLRADTPSPDLWAHNSPRATSNLAIAAPLLPDQQGLSRSATPLRSSTQPPDEEDDDDPFDPFPAALVNNFHAITISDFDTHHWPPPDNGDPQLYYPGYPPDGPPLDAPANGEPEDTALLTDGMTPFDVLSSVFGSTLAPSELEEALAANGFDFDRAMAWLIDRSLPPAQSPQARPPIHKFTTVGRDAAMRGGGRGFVPTSPPNRGAAPRYGPNNGRPAPNGNRVCRYFVAGECLRADCRFSHDLERALCRFWLRGMCAKHEACEFLHHLPKDVDINSLNQVLSRANVPPGTGPLANLHPGPPVEEFPALGSPPTTTPGRTRFAAAVKKPAPLPLSNSSNGNGADGVPPGVRRDVMGPAADNLHHQSAIVAPRPSHRIKLRPPVLMPTLPTGDALNNLYMSYRSRALQLGAARNACLSRAADAWRRGDGAAAKRFSREGHELNGKMGVEMADAAAKLVRERAKVAEQAVRAREASWSDDGGDRSARGKVCGGGLGVVLGIASGQVGDGKLTSEERTEVMLDLHGLHSNEANEVLEKFLMALEREHFLGLAYVIVGEEKHTGTQDAARGASRLRLATGVREWLHRWGYPWSERDGIICIDPLSHHSE
ncbi:hypothetical protein DFP72DRAFT_1069749 [Ephemerocybe angulata]|uniref:Uncharacterized protein n=1 Tax=Ephemerocybe angulata TaxID=980116 RepID=A0A8H6M5I6_9AGAR|nr:hypothetical protein DFP72DRAFT_1069749 [Tulosesus angulatus]